MDMGSWSRPDIPEKKGPHYGASGGRPFWSDFQHFQKRSNSADGAIFPCTLVMPAS